MPLYRPVITAISTAETKRYAGLNHNKPFSPEMIQSACQEALALMRPQCSWQEYAYLNATGYIEAIPPLIVAGNSIISHLAKSERIIIMAATIGTALETGASDYFRKGEYTRGLLLDAAGTTAVETAADLLTRLLREQAAKKGFVLTTRFSPGYGDWDIAVQPGIAKLANAADIGIGVTDSCMLIPRKSITAVLGLMPSLTTPTTADCMNHNCLNCSQPNCIARKEKTK